MSWRFDFVSDITVVVGNIIIIFIMCKAWNWHVMKQYTKQKEKKLSFAKIFCEKYLEKIEIVGTGNDGNSDFDVLDAIGKIELPNNVRIKV